jgi:hypothetical protein
MLDREAIRRERDPQEWTPVLRQRSRSNKTLELRCGSIGTEKAPGHARLHAFAAALGVSIGAMLLAAMPVRAGDDVSSTPVRQRSHPDYEPMGMRIDAFTYYPSATASLQYDSNVFADAEPVSDWALVTAPQLRVVSERPDGLYELSVGAKNYVYHRFDEQNRTDAHARFKVRKEISSDIKWSGDVEVARRYEVQGDSFADEDAAEPIPYNDIRAETAVIKTFNRLGVTIGGKLRNLSYENVDAIGGGVLDQSYRDGTIITTTLKPFYEFSPGYRGYARIDLSRRDYEGQGLLNRDSEGYDARGGLDFRVTSLVFGSIEVGYLSYDYANPLIPTVDGLSASARVMWLMTPLMTLSMFADRSVAETAAAGQEGRLDFSAGAVLDYELMRNLILSFEGVYKNEDFVGTSRSDDVVRLSAKLDYLFSRSFNFGVQYNYIDRSSNIADVDYDKHMVILNVTAQH